MNLGCLNQPLASVGVPGRQAADQEQALQYFQVALDGLAYVTQRIGGGRDIQQRRRLVGQVLEQLCNIRAVFDFGDIAYITLDDGLQVLALPATGALRFSEAGLRVAAGHQAVRQGKLFTITPAWEFRLKSSRQPTPEKVTGCAFFFCLGEWLQG